MSYTTSSATAAPGKWFTPRNATPQPPFVPLQVKQETIDKRSQHLPTAYLNPSASQTAPPRNLRRETTACDWTAAAAAARAADGELPGGFQRSTVTLRAAPASRQCNASIPVLLLWHEDVLPTGLSPSCSTTQEHEREGNAHTPSAAGAVQEGAAQRLPVVVWLHSTGGRKEDMVPRMESFAKQGFLAVSMDFRYHGERMDQSGPCEPQRQYEDAVYRCAAARGAPAC